jgi:pyruvate-formate lyase
LEPRRSHWVGTVADQMGGDGRDAHQDGRVWTLAQECRATALTLSTEQARAEMLTMADVCDRVADHHAPDVSEARAVVRLMAR